KPMRAIAILVLVGASVFALVSGRASAAPSASDAALPLRGGQEIASDPLDPIDASNPRQPGARKAQQPIPAKDARATQTRIDVGAKAGEVKAWSPTIGLPSTPTVQLPQPDEDSDQAPALRSSVGAAPFAGVEKIAEKKDSNEKPAFGG